VLTLGAAAYQRVTGPTHPRRVTYGQGERHIAARLPRSQGGPGGAAVEIEAPRTGVTGTLRFRRYPTDEPWQEVPLARRGDRLSGELPHQPPAGKLEYVVVLEEDGRPLPSDADSATVIRFKGEVPVLFLVPHIALMFATMLLATVAGLKALVRAPRHLGYAWAAFVLLVAGGLVLGPIVQRYAFGELWTGIPFGWDLTDNKVGIAFVAWLAALLANVRRRRPAWIVAAAVLLLVVYSIPHSVLGSELDPATGRVVTG
jgi:hypothetical protein